MFVYEKWLFLHHGTYEMLRKPNIRKTKQEAAAQSQEIAQKLNTT